MPSDVINTCKIAVKLSSFDYSYPLKCDVLWAVETL